LLNDLIIYGASAFADIVSAYGVPASNLAGGALASALNGLMNMRAEAARKILLDEIQSGMRSPRDPGEVDEFVAILYRYMRAAQEGAARLNLRLMAKVVKHQFVEDNLRASEFLRYADIISSLTREEVVVLATYHREETEFKNKRLHEDWSDVQSIDQNVRKALVPKVFKTYEDLLAVVTAVQRTGMLWPASTLVSGGFIYQGTPLLKTVVQIANFQSVIDSEPQ
jgi:quinol monooxygenase YgiN